MIPKIIHRMWLDKNDDFNTNFPEKYNNHVATFTQYHPEFTVYFWNMTRVKTLFETMMPAYYEAWLNMPSHIQKCDFARFAILYIYGGVYADLDFSYYRNISPLLNRELLLVLEPPEHSINDDIDARLYNGFIGSIPGHNFWLDWMNNIIISLTKTSNVMNTTGPVNFRRWFDTSSYRNTELVNTCDILPIYNGNKPSLTKECAKRIGPEYNPKLLGNYADTKWIEGTGWGNLALVDFFKSPPPHNRFIYFILALLIVLLIISLISLLRCSKI